jgi:PAS domain S-box-containing protein
MTHLTTISRRITWLPAFMALLPKGTMLEGEDWRRRHQGILFLLWLHAAAIPWFGVLAGNTPSRSVTGGFIVAALSACATWAPFANRWRGVLTTVGLMVSSTVLVHLSGGYIEMHFHYFVMMAVIVLYQDWVTFLVAVVYIVMDHGLLGTLVPSRVFNHHSAQAHPWIWAQIHGIFVLAESLALLVFWRLTELAQSDANEKALRARQIIDTALDAVVCMDEQDRITDWSHRAEQMFGWEREEVMGRSLADTIIPLRYREAHRRGLQYYLSTGEGPVLNRRIEVVALRRNESEFPIDLAITPLKIAGRHMFTAFVEDITERKRVESELKQAKETAEAANVAKSQFLANMSHEIRTPMNGVLGMAELLLGTPLEAKQRRYAEHVQTSGTNLLHLINDILDFSKLEAGKLTLEQVPFDIRALVTETSELFLDRANKKGLILISQLPATLPALVSGDPHRLRQILTNLIGNALKFTESGSICIEVSALESSDAGWRIHFAVADTGIGIPFETQASIFDSFSQADGSTTRKYGGTGLGLTIVKQLVAMMGGTIEVSSVPGQGARFWFTALFAHPVARAEGQGVTIGQPAIGLDAA